MSTNPGPSLCGQVEERLPLGQPAPRPTHPHFGLREPSRVPEDPTEIHITHLGISKQKQETVPSLELSEGMFYEVYEVRSKCSENHFGR